MRRAVEIEIAFMRKGPKGIDRLSFMYATFRRGHLCAIQVIHATGRTY